ncbi:hypothetical protein CRE_29126 [Caenorhabditis remanei]|uniref:Uncharacterized protein n=1 Tax=Caenorhabditis remanei TaxID=31234 RepID=E3N4N5_CAERE|nr:hypothetical protein CRE_29126 [Caenorhabditis remanei]
MPSIVRFLDVLFEEITVARWLKPKGLEEWLVNVLYHNFDLILEDDCIKNNNEPGLQQFMSKHPCNEELEKLKRKSVHGTKNEKEDDGDMESPVDEGSRGPQRDSSNFWNFVCLGSSIGNSLWILRSLPIGFLY